MILRQRFDPDIEVKYHQIVAHMHQKNKVIEEFSQVLKDLCDWQMFNSRNLDKFANSISKLLVGKDPLKDTFIIFERILASKSDQANKVALSIKQDMLPFLENAINFKDQTSIKSQEQSIKELKQTMHQKIRLLYSAEMNYKGINQKMKSFSSSSMMQSRQKIEEMTKMKRELLDAETHLTEVINLYNHTVEDYMLNYSKLCEQLSEIQTNRKVTIKQSISKFIVFEMDAIKNIEYDLCRHAKIIEKMEDKMIIQEKITHENDFKSIQLAKISSNNYINYLLQRQTKDSKSSNFQTESQRKMNEIKQFLDPLKQNLQLTKDSFTSLMTDINDLLSQAIEVYDIKTVKEIVYYSSNYHIISSHPINQKVANQSLGFRKTQIPLLKAVLCHPIFVNQAFWQKYHSRIADIVQKEISSSNFKRADQNKISLSLLSSDIEFMKKISSCPLVDKILTKFTKYTTDSSQHILKSTDSIKTKSQSARSKLKIKEKEKSETQKCEEKIQASDFVYF